MNEQERGLGKCSLNHPGSFGYPTRPAESYLFCSQCGKPMVWSCSSCGAALPEDSTELIAARFCRHCGTPYFEDDADDAV